MPEQPDDESLTSADEPPHVASRSTELSLKLSPAVQASIRATAAAAANLKLSPELLASMQAATRISPEALASMQAATRISPEALASMQAAISPGLLKIGEVIAAAIAADLPRFTMPKFDLPPGLLSTLRRIKEMGPPNWPDGMDYDHLEAVSDDGIPLVWVPRAAIVAEVLAAPDRGARVQVLLDHRSEVIADCRKVLEETTSSQYANEVALGFRALQALKDGTDEASQALAVVILDTSTQKAIAVDHNQVKNRVKVDDQDDLTLIEFRLLMGLAPLHRFLTSWTAGKTPGPPPEALSRHVSVHGASVEHYTDANAIIAVMLMTSVLRAYQELEEIRNSTGDQSWPWQKKGKGKK